MIRPLTLAPYWIGRLPNSSGKKGPNRGIAEISERGRIFQKEIVFAPGKNNSKPIARLVTWRSYFKPGEKIWIAVKILKLIGRSQARFLLHTNLSVR